MLTATATYTVAAPCVRWKESVTVSTTRRGSKKASLQTKRHSVQVHRRRLLTMRKMSTLKWLEPHVKFQLLRSQIDAVWRFLVVLSARWVCLNYFCTPRAGPERGHQLYEENDERQRCEASSIPRTSDALAPAANRPAGSDSAFALPGGRVSAHGWASKLHRGQVVHELGRLSLTNHYDNRLKPTSFERNVNLYEDLSDLTRLDMTEIETKRKEGMLRMDVDLWIFNGGKHMRVLTPCTIVAYLW